MPKILVVDDSPAMRELVRKGVNDSLRSNCEIYEAADGEEALEAMAHEDFDLVVSDLNMPGVDGVQLVRRARELSCSVPVLMVASEADRAQEAIDAGANDCLAKPFSPEQLAEKIRRLLE